MFRWGGHGLGISLVLAVGLAGLVACSDDEDGMPEGRVVGDGEAYEATIRRTEDGVPHIVGETLGDVVFGQGWASGEDRACDLADQVLKIRGERSRWFGRGDDDANVDSDFAWRAIGIVDRAWSDWAGASPEVREAVVAYTDGWNAHLDHVGADNLAGWCAGAEWVEPLEPADVYAYARSIALFASSVQLVDYIPTAQPPAATPAAAARTSIEVTDPAQVVAGFQRLGRDLGSHDSLGSNGWAIGAERSESGGGMLLANPHFPWEGELRFWEVHLTIPGELDAYGVQLSGLPGIGIGFNEHVGWTHTVSAGNRFTAYTLDLVPGDPTSYRYGDGTREMTPTEHTVEVRGEDGEVTEETRTLWSSHYGPVIDFPGVGWSDTQAITYRDANLDDDEIIAQYLGMVQARDLDDFVAVHEEVSGIPLFNTIAVSDDGRAWYGDTSATPNLSDEAIAAYEQARETDFVVGAAADAGAVLLDGSDPRFEWQEVDGARDPGLVPFDEMPTVERDDYVFNANDSFWLPHATEVLAGGYSPLHGLQETARSPRTRENAVVLDDTSADGPAGEDGDFSLDELADAALQNEGYTARALRADVVELCRDHDSVDVPALPTDDAEDPDGQALPAATVDVGPACDVLADWDGRYDLDSVGAVVWRETMSRFGPTALTEAGELWAEPFDPAHPVATPSGLSPAPLPDGPAGTPAVLVNLARAVQVLDAAGIPVDAPLGDVQFALRDGEQVPIHGGDAGDGTTNVVGTSGLGATTLDPDTPEIETGTFAPSSQLGRFEDTVGYGVDFGTSFLMALEITGDGIQARAFLTYSNTEDRTSGDFLAATQRFSEKDWRSVAYAEDDIDQAATTTVTVRG
jgi:acyl-homoserine-lactone acylase